MEGSKKGILIVAGVAGAAIVIAMLFSGFSIGAPTNPANPFGPGEGPPRIVMVYNGEQYEGELRGYAYDSQTDISKLPDVNLVNATEISPGVVNVQRGSELQFVVRGNPAQEAQFDSLAVSVLTEDGRPVAVLDPRTPQNDSYAIDQLDEGEYILSSVATWNSDENREEISGYVVYGHRIAVVP